MIYSSIVLLLNDVDPNFRHQANKQAWLKRRWIPEGAISDWRNRQFKTHSSVLAFTNMQTSGNSVCHAAASIQTSKEKVLLPHPRDTCCIYFLRFQDALEVMFVRELLTCSWLCSQLDWCDSGEWWYQLKTLGTITPTKFTEFSENYVALFATKFFGVQRPHPFSLPKKRNKIFWIGNSSNLVQVVFP